MSALSPPHDSFEVRESPPSVLELLANLDVITPDDIKQCRAAIQECFLPVFDDAGTDRKNLYAAIHKLGYDKASALARASVDRVPGVHSFKSVITAAFAMLPEFREQWEKEQKAKKDAQAKNK